MDPCPFARLIVESLALKLPNQAARPSGGPGVHPAAAPCFCRLRLKGLPSQTALVPLSPTADSSSSAAVVFHLDAAAIRRLSAAPPAVLRVSVRAGRGGAGGGKLIGRARVGVAGLAGAEARAAVLHGGWVKLSGGGGGEGEEARVHVVVRSEPDPRFVFHFGGEPECSPVVFQIQGSIPQPVFSCNFTADRNSARCRSLPSDFNGSAMAAAGNNNRGGWLTRTFSRRKRDQRAGRERKGWTVTIHDLSGSPVAAASMITPFVPSSPGSDRVSRSNPGAWLILRPDPAAAWKPWGRLEAWRELGPADGLGLRFELVSDAAARPIAEATLSARRGGRFCIDGGGGRGFVMGSTVGGEGQVSRPVVHVGVQHVTCTPDAALFVALSAAVDLSMDACRLFSQKLRRELCHNDDGNFLS